MPPTFGQTIRGLRLGYHWSYKHGCMIRIGEPGPPWEVSLCPPDMLPKGSRKGSVHRCWRDGGAAKGEDILGLILDLQTIRCVKKPVKFFVNYEGERV